MARYEKTILLVDDDEKYLAYLAESIRSCGCRILTKTNGHAALAVFDEGTTVDLVVTDHFMPGMNGLEFMEAVRKRTQTLPILLLTAYADVETYFSALKFGAYEVTCKPISEKTLRAIVQAALSCPKACRNEVASGKSDSTVAT